MKSDVDYYRINPLWCNKQLIKFYKTEAHYIERQAKWDISVDYWGRIFFNEFEKLYDMESPIAGHNSQYLEQKQKVQWLEKQFKIANHQSERRIDMHGLYESPDKTD